MDQEGGNGEPEPTAASGRFLLDCTEKAGVEKEGILDVRTGVITMLPEGPSGSKWQRAGARYVEGSAADQTCQRTKTKKGPGERCVGLYDLATSAVIDRAAWQIPDLDRPGAPAVCKHLRSNLLAGLEFGFSRRFGYADGLFAHVTARSGEARIDRCHGRPTVLHGRGEPANFDLRGGLLTWDTGHPFFVAGEEDTSRGRLTSYRLSNGKRHSWALPSLSLEGYESGVFGYSTHTASTVFWIASRTLGCEKIQCVATSSVYAAPIR